MKKLLFAGVVLVLAFIAASPLIALNNIKQGIETNNSALLSKSVDFPLIREDLKIQVNGYLQKKFAHEQGNSPFAAFGMSLASSLVDGVVNSYVTPTGLADLLSGQAKDQAILASSSGGEVAADAKQSSNDLFKNAKLAYVSFNRFKVEISSDEGGVTTFLLFRDGLFWKLSRIILPLGTD